jgi:hypothetical protein
MIFAKNIQKKAAPSEGLLGLILNQLKIIYLIRITICKIIKNQRTSEL